MLCIYIESNHNFEGYKCGMTLDADPLVGGDSGPRLTQRLLRLSLRVDASYNEDYSCFIIVMLS